MNEGIVKDIKFNNVWYEIKVEGFEKPIMVHRNWFISRGDEFNENLIKVGDKVRFEIANPIYKNDKDHIYVKNFDVVKEVEDDVSV